MSTDIIGYTVVDEFGDIATYPPVDPEKPWQRETFTTETTLRHAETELFILNEQWDRYYAQRKQESPWFDRRDVDRQYRVAELVGIS